MDFQTPSKIPCHRDFIKLLKLTRPYLDFYTAHQHIYYYKYMYKYLKDKLYYRETYELYYTELFKPIKPLD